MAALTKDTPRKYSPDIPPHFLDVPCKVSTTFYEGGAVTDDGGNGEADMLALSENFIGFVEKGVVSSATTSDVNVKVRTMGIIHDLPVTGATGDTTYGQTVYATTSGDFTLTSSTTFVTIGKVVGYGGTSGFCDVYFEGVAVRSI